MMRETVLRRRGTAAFPTRGPGVDTGGTSGSAPLRILMVTPRYWPTTGGVQNHVAEVSRRLAALGHDVTVLTSNPGEAPETEEQDGVAIRRVRAYPRGRDYTFAPAIVSVIASGRWDVVHVQSYHTLVAPLAMLAAWRAGVPYVLTFHGGGHPSVWRNRLRGAQVRLLRPLLARAARLVAVAEHEIALYGDALHLPRSRFVLIPNGGDLPADAAAGIAPDPDLIVSIGRLEAYKGHQRILGALPAIVRSRPRARLWIAGSGPYENSLRAQAAALGVADRVIIRAVPPADRAEMAGELSRAGLVVLFSDFETHPIGVLEALSLRRPVLTSEAAGLRPLAEQGLTRAIPLDSSPEAIAATVLQELAHPRTVPAGVVPTWNACAAGLLSLYQEAVGRVACAS